MGRFGLMRGGLWVVVLFVLWWGWEAPTVRVRHVGVSNAACLGAMCVVVPGRSVEGASFFEFSVGEYR